jgi:hypothetical protein
MELVEDLQKNGFEIVWASPRSEKILVSVWMEVCPEKANWSDRQLITEGYRTRDKIDKQYWLQTWRKRFDECRRLESELKSKEKSIQQLCKRVVDLKAEVEKVTVLNHE